MASLWQYHKGWGLAKGNTRVGAKFVVTARLVWRYGRKATQG